MHAYLQDYVQVCLPDLVKVWIALVLAHWWFKNPNFRSHILWFCIFQRNIRSATRMLVLVTCTYLLANVMNVLVTVWEFVDYESLFLPHIRPFYTMSSDIVSLLTVLASCSRLPIYCSCNSSLRHEIADALKKAFCCRRRKLPGFRRANRRSDSENNVETIQMTSSRSRKMKNEMNGRHFYTIGSLSWIPKTKKMREHSCRSNVEIVPNKKTDIFRDQLGQSGSVGGNEPYNQANEQRQLRRRLPPWNWCLRRTGKSANFWGNNSHD